MDEPSVVEIVDRRLARDGTRLFTTLEGENPSGSIKDRMVLGELTELLEAGRLQPGDRVSEISAGSTARALAFHSRELGLRCDLFVPDSVDRREIEALESLGASVQTGTRESGFALYEQFCAAERPHRFEQLSDHSLLRHYSSLGAAVDEEVGPIDTVIGSVGTGHSLLGVAGGIEPAPFVVTAEPAEPNAVLGIRNVELERFGPQDTCKPELFDQRLVLDAGARRDLDRVLTDRGEMTIGRSFALVLSAAELLLRQRPVERLFLVGAENRL